MDMISSIIKNASVPIRAVSTGSAPTSATNIPPNIVALPQGSVLRGTVGYINNRGHVVVHTSRGDIALKTNIFMKHGIEIMLRLEGAKDDMMAKIVRVDGQSLQKYVEGQKSRANEPIVDGLKNTSLNADKLAVKGGEAVAKNFSGFTSSTPLKAIMLTNGSRISPDILSNLPPQLAAIIAKSATGTELQIKVKEMALPSQLSKADLSKQTVDPSSNNPKQVDNATAKPVVHSQQSNNDANASSSLTSGKIAGNNTKVSSVSAVVTAPTSPESPARILDKAILKSQLSAYQNKTPLSSTPSPVNPSAIDSISDSQSSNLKNTGAGAQDVAKANNTNNQSQANTNTQSPSKSSNQPPPSTIPAVNTNNPNEQIVTQPSTQDIKQAKPVSDNISAQQNITNSSATNINPVNKTSIESPISPQENNLSTSATKETLIKGAEGLPANNAGAKTLPSSSGFSATTTPEVISAAQNRQASVSTLPELSPQSSPAKKIDSEGVTSGKTAIKIPSTTQIISADTKNPNPVQPTTMPAAQSPAHSQNISINNDTTRSPTQVKAETPVSNSINTTQPQANTSQQPSPSVNTTNPTANNQATLPQSGNMTPAVTPPLVATVIESPKSGALTLHSELGAMRLFSPSQLPTGTQLTIDITDIISSQTPIPLSKQDNITETKLTGMEALSELTYASVRGMDNTPIHLIPRVNGGGLIAEIIFTLIAMKNSPDLKSWTNQGSFSALDNLTTDMIGKISSEFSAMRSGHVEPKEPNQWSSLIFPIATEGEIQPVKMYYRHQERDNPNEGDRKDDADHFIIDVNLTNLGAMQLDGFVVKPQKVAAINNTDEYRLSFDLMVRSQQIFPDEIQNSIRQIFVNALELVGAKGMIAFKTGKESLLDLPNVGATINLGSENSNDVNYDDIIV